MRRLIDYVVESAKVWDHMPSYQRLGRLEYFSRLQAYLDHIRGGIERGRLTPRQVREFRTLERLARDAMGTVKILKAKDAEMRKREEDKPR